MYRSRRSHCRRHLRHLPHPLHPPRIPLRPFSTLFSQIQHGHRSITIRLPLPDLCGLFASIGRVEFNTGVRREQGFYYQVATTGKSFLYQHPSSLLCVSITIYLPIILIINICTSPSSTHYKVDYNSVAFVMNNLASQWLAVRLDLIGSFISFFIAVIACATPGGFIPAGFLALGLSYSFQLTTYLKFAVRMMATMEANDLPLIKPLFMQSSLQSSYCRCV